MENVDLRRRSLFSFLLTESGLSATVDFRSIPARTLSDVHF